MFRKIILLSVFLLLSYGFWVSPNLKQITAGVAIFLFGMLTLEEGFKVFSGGILEKILNKSTNKLWKSMSFGVFTTTLMQSSSLVSVITISFLSAGLITLASGIGIIFGANLGTTTGAWLVAGFGLKVKISAYAMPMLVFGIILVLQKQKELKGIGYVLAGMGFLFLGIHFMKEGFETFREHIDLTAYAVSGLKGLLLYALIGVLATVIMQSSHATLVLIITALASQQITYDNALALAIGSNIGTTITAILGSISANVNGKRLAGAHFVFNLITGAIAIALITQLIQVVDWLSLHLGISSDNYTLKLAVFHTLFNIIGIVVMLPFMGKLESFLIQFLPEKTRDIAEAEYLYSVSTELPDTALEAVRKETLNLYNYFFGIISHGLSFRVRDIKSHTPVKEIIKSEQKPIPVNIKKEYTSKIKGLYAEIVDFISQVHDNLSKKQTNEIFEYRSAGRRMLESIKSVQQLHINLAHHLNDSNPYIREEYNKIRFRLGTILRTLADLQSAPEDERVAMSTLEAMRIEIKDANKRIFTDIDELIRKHDISAKMATSLMNDSYYANNIAKNLLSIGKILFKSRNSAMDDVEQSLLLDEEETAKAIAARKSLEDNSKSERSTSGEN